MALYGGMELGGTNIVCAWAHAPTDPLVDGQNRYEFRTSDDPHATIQEAARFFAAAPEALAGLGVGTFGPVDLESGCITTTPKRGWAGFPLLPTLRASLPNLPIRLDTDVNGAALGEWHFGAGKGLQSLVYATIGTGIGAGAILGGRMLHGFTHSEMGHISVKPHPHDATTGFKGVCPYHELCLEGMASGEAVKRRWGWDGFTPNNPNWELAWEVEAFYIGQFIVAMICILAPERVILGGGVMLNQPTLLPRVHEAARTLLNGYVQHPRLDDWAGYVVTPALGDNAGMVGALVLARMAT